MHSTQISSLLSFILVTAQAALTPKFGFLFTCFFFPFRDRQPSNVTDIFFFLNKRVSILVTYYHVTNYVQTQHLFSSQLLRVRNLEWLSYYLCSKAPTRLQLRCTPGHQSSQGLTWEEYTSKLPHVFTVMIQFLASFQPETCSLPGGHLHWATHNMAAGFPQGESSKRKWGRTSRNEATVLL